MSSTDERSLAAKVSQGDRDAFAEIVRRHQQAVFNAAYRVLGTFTMRKTPHKMLSSGPISSSTGLTLTGRSRPSWFGLPSMFVSTGSKA
jgi:hypothetical protein